MLYTYRTVYEKSICTGIVSAPCRSAAISKIEKYYNIDDTSPILLGPGVGADDVWETESVANNSTEVELEKMWNDNLKYS